MAWQEGGDLLVIKNEDRQRAADLLLLMGEPLREPVVAQGTWVFNSYPEVSIG